MPDFFDPTAAMYAAPDLLQTPELAIAAGSSPDPMGDGQMLAHTSNVVATSNAVQQHAQTHGSGFVHGLFGAIGSAVNDVKDAGSWALKQIARPLGDVQHDYRYLRDVYQRHGFFAGTAETLGIAAAGATAGFFTAGIGTAAGAAAAASTEQRLFYQDSADATRDGNAYLLNGQHVSPGRDLAGLLHLGSTDSGVGKVVSGLGDAAFDFAADPTIIAGKASAARKSLEGLTGLRGYTRATMEGRTTALTNFVDRFAPGMGIYAPVKDAAGNFVGRQLATTGLDQVDAARIAYPEYRRALNDIAGLDAGGIVSKYGRAMGGLAPDLAKATDADAVHEVFRQAAHDVEFNGRLSSSMLPSRALLRVPFSAAAERLRMVGSDTKSEVAPLAADAPVMDKIAAVRDSNASSQTLDSSRSLTGAVLNSVLHPTNTASNLAGAVQRKVNTFTGVAPFDVDKGMDIDRVTFDPKGTSGLHGLLQVGKMSMGEQAARRWVNLFAQEPTEAGKKAIYTEMLTDVYKAAGVADDPDMMEQIHSLVGGKVAGVASNELYGQGRTLGSKVSEVTHGQGTDQLALYLHQKGNFAYPDFFQLKNAVRNLNSAKTIYGKVDDSVAHYYTNGFFKPLSLVTAGFGLRVAASELIPATFRYGAASLLANRIGVTAAKFGYKQDATDNLYAQAEEAENKRAAAEAAGNSDLAMTHADNVARLIGQADESEPGHIMSAMARAAGGMAKLLRVSPDDQEFYAHMIMHNEGQFVKGLASTGDNSAFLQIDPTERQAGAQWYLKQRVGKIPWQADTDSFQALTRDANQYQDYWLAGLQKRSREASGQLISRDLLDLKQQGLAEPEIFRQAITREADRLRNFNAPDDPYKAERDVLARYPKQKVDEFATHRVDDMMNHLYGDDSTFHTGLAQQLAAGMKPTREELDAIPEQSRPGTVVGNPMVPHIPQNLLQAAVQSGFRKLVDPVISYISREPIFAAAVKQNYKVLKDAVDSGALTPQEAMTRAMYRGSIDMLPQIHNTALRSQFSLLARNYLPFYFAQEQALKRTGYLISQHPAALEQYQIIEHGLSDPNFVHVDDQGNRQLMIPFASGIGTHFFNAASALGLPLQGGLPLSVSGDMASLKTVIPEIQQPGVSPITALSLGALAHFFPEYSQEVKDVVGARGYGRSLSDELIPNSVLRNLYKAWNASDGDKSFTSSFATALAAASFHGQVPPPDASPAEQQAFIDRIKNNTRSLYFIKAILAAISPLSPRVSQEDSGLSDEFHKLTAKMGYGKGAEEFLKRHGDKAISYTVAKSESTNGAQIPYTNNAIDFVNANRDLITNGKTQLAAAALVPQDGKQGDIQTIHDEMLRMNLRARKTPEEFRNSIYVQQGNRQYFADYPAHKAAMDQLANDPQGLAVERANWKQYVDGMKLANPIWAADFFSPVKSERAQQTIAQLHDLFASGQAPAGEQTDLVKSLYDDYAAHQQALASLGSDRSFGAQRTTEKDNWDAYLAQREKEEPRLASVINSVFKPLGRTGG